LVNGHAVDSIAIDDRGLAYGDGLFETIKVIGGNALHASLHWQRLEHGCQQLKLRCDFKRLQSEVDGLLQSVDGQAHILKIIITRQQAERGYRASENAETNRYISLQKIVVNTQWQQGVAVRVCDHRLASNHPLAAIKHLSRLDNVLARSEWSNAVAEGLMLDQYGHVVEGTASNLFLIKGTQLITPSLHRCGVAGVIRQLIIEQLSQRCGLTAVVKDLKLADCYSADEMFICNSLMGICPVIAVGCHLKNCGPNTLQLQAALSQLDACKEIKA
jgi:4-amino-4-deoxychorismate lyase